MKRYLFCLIAFFIVSKSYSQTTNSTFIRTQKPWTYWWWQGSAVDSAGIKNQLQQFKLSGLGGAHIIPIYGVRGEESHFLPFLGKDWLTIFKYTCEEAKKLELGIDLSNGTGWPFGGPKITSEEAPKQLVFTELQSNDTLNIKKAFGKNTFSTAQIFKIDANGVYTALTVSQLHELANTSPNPKILLITYESTNQKVKRAAPGGEGLVVDHFDPKAMSRYLGLFDSTLFASSLKAPLRALYNDSYEVFGANWSTDFFKVFKQQHHYDLKDVTYVLSPNYPAGIQKEKTMSDYRETLSSMLYATESVWAKWAETHNVSTRYQAHGAPGNLLDLYALSTIPETESFGSSSFKIPLVRVDPDYQEKNFGRPYPLIFKLASSPAHLLGKQLIASETSTWLGNHFKVALSQIKPQIDELFIAGINHIIYHGTTYSPPSEPFPGRLFYASTNYGPSAHFRNELPLLNHYISICQQQLQNSVPDNEILVYMPIYDFWSNIKEPLLFPFTVHHSDKWFLQNKFGQLADRLWNSGYSFDYISDLQLSKLKYNSDRSVSIGKIKYQVIVVPTTTNIPLETLNQLLALSKQGIKVIFQDRLPLSLPGNGRNEEQKQFDQAKELSLVSKNIIVGDVSSALNMINIKHETLSSAGLNFIRSKTKTGLSYFITNLSNQFQCDTITLSASAESLEYFNPLTNVRGLIAFKKVDKTIKTKLYLPPGSSCFLNTFSKSKVENEYHFPVNSKSNLELTNWSVSFKEGAPFVPTTTFNPKELTSWTAWQDSTLNWYNGYGNYQTTIILPESWKQYKGVYLKIEDLRETANINLNGVDCGTIWAVPFEIFIPIVKFKIGQPNRFILKVRNLSANQARYLDTYGVNWKHFYDANIVDITYRPFDASKWKHVESGIIGKVKLVAIE